MSNTYYPNSFKIPGDDVQGGVYVGPNRHKKTILALWRESRRPDLLGLHHTAPNYLPLEEARTLQRGAFLMRLVQWGFDWEMRGRDILIRPYQTPLDDIPF